MKTIYPECLKPGAHIRVIAPSLSMAILSEETIKHAMERFEQMGFKISFGRHVNEINQFGSSSIKSRIYDLHEAFSDPSVQGIITAIGGYNSNQLLEYIDWSLLQKNPKFFCGYSDITILHNAILSQTELVTYYGPHFSTFGQKLLDLYTIDNFVHAATQKDPFLLSPAKVWSNDKWYLDQDNRELLDNEGYWVLQEGQSSGAVIGGHLGTTCLLQGTNYMPSLEGKILIIEEDAEPANPNEFDRRLQSILQQPKANMVAGVLIGRFEKAYGMTRELLSEIIKTKKTLHGKPIIANVDFGHTEPHCTIPVGGIVEITAEKNKALIRILAH
jgi:muramoyltetrapeptide carboxypeptidase